MIEHMKTRYSSPYEMYRAFYKYTACGPSMGICVDNEWTYCDRLRRFGDFEQMEQKGMKVYALMFSSIVEGTDQEVPAQEIRQDFATSDLFWDAVEAVVESIDKEAHDIWLDTHGCDTCAAHWNKEAQIEEGHSVYEFGDCPVWDKCPDCDGDGVAN